MSKKVLIVDDEKLMRESLHEALTRAGLKSDMVASGEEAKVAIDASYYDLVICDIRMPGISGIELLRCVKRVSPETAVVMMTAFGTVDTAIKAMRYGACDYLTKPFSFEEIEIIVKKALDHQNVVRENKYLRKELHDKYNFENFVGEDLKMKEVFKTIQKVSNSKATVLIRGESGTGKELVARAIHYLSDRKESPFIKVNCAALSPGLLESELFGHEKGAFTGAHMRKLGRFELADGGTLLLDEVSEMNISLQSKLLRVLQEKEFDRVGGVNPIETDVRIIATTNRDIEKEIEKGNFRDDLYYRLNVIPIELPPLRERKGDIPLMMDYFLKKYSEENNKRLVGFETEVYDLLGDYSWPGNVRELENVIERAAVLCSGEMLLKEYFKIKSKFENNFNVIQENLTGLQQESDLNLRLSDVEREYIYFMLGKHKGNKTRASDALGISVRTLRNKLDEYEKVAVLK
jgi:two-component system, NtrC family, response regulator AtoC